MGGEDCDDREGDLTFRQSTLKSDRQALPSLRKEGRDHRQLKRGDRASKNDPRLRKRPGDRVTLKILPANAPYKFFSVSISR
jgi:hypothetical protein